MNKLGMKGRDDMILAYCTTTGEFLGFVFANISGVAFIATDDGAVVARAHAAISRRYRRSTSI